MSTDAEIYQSLLKGDRLTMKDLSSIKVVQQLTAACTTIRTTVWEHLGFELGLSKHSLAMIQTDHSNIESRCSAMLKLWLQSKADASWETLKKALRLSDLDQLASMIDQQLLTERTSPTSETKGSITHQKLSVEPSQGGEPPPMSEENNSNPAAATKKDGKSMTISKEEFQSYDSVGKAFIALQTKMKILFRKADYSNLRIACIAQKNNPDGAELSQVLVGEIKAAENIDELIDVLVCSPYWSWIDLRIMEAMVVASDSSQAQELLDNYKAAIFTKRLIDVLPNVPSKEVKEEYYTKIAAKLMKDPNEVTVAHLLEFQSQLEGVILDIRKGICILEHLDRGCVETYWHIPTSLVDKAYQNAKTKRYQFKNLCLLYLKIGHHPVIHDPLNQMDHMSVPIASVDVDVLMKKTSVQLISHYQGNSLL